MNDYDQEVQWLREEIEQDEHVMGTSDFSSFHRERLEENKEKWLELTGNEWKE